MGAGTAHADVEHEARSAEAAGKAEDVSGIAGAGVW
jgi:hypothetical protein